MATSQKEIEANRMYNKILKLVYKLLGKGITYSDQLDYVGKKLLSVKFKKCYPSDKIPKLSDLAPYCILNLDRSNEPGSHWVALAKIPNKNSCILYDSFARSHKKILKELNFSGNGRVTESKRDVDQKISQNDCGARSMAFLILLDQKGVDVAKLI